MNFFSIYIGSSVASAPDESLEKKHRKSFKFFKKGKKHDKHGDDAVQQETAPQAPRPDETSINKAKKVSDHTEKHSETQPPVKASKDEEKHEDKSASTTSKTEAQVLQTTQPEIVEGSQASHEKPKEKTAEVRQESQQKTVDEPLEAQKPEDEHREIQKPEDQLPAVQQPKDEHCEMQKPEDQLPEVQPPEDEHREIQKPEDQLPEVQQPEDKHREIEKPEEEPPEVQTAGDENIEVLKPEGEKPKVEESESAKPDDGVLQRDINNVETKPAVIEEVIASHDEITVEVSPETLYDKVNLMT